MSGGNGTKYVTLPEDDQTHVLRGDLTVCGLPVPAFSDYSWSYTLTGEPCSDCGLETPEEAPKKKARSGGKA